MENRQLLDLAIKYGLKDTQVTKITSIMYQAGVADSNSREFSRIATYLCEAKIIDLPAEEIIEELKKKGIIQS